MKQKALTEKQQQILVKLEAVLKEANEANIGFVYDDFGGELTAYNTENVKYLYRGTSYDVDDGDEIFDWESGYYLDCFNCDNFHSTFDNCYLKFS